MGHSRRYISRSTFGRYGYSTKALHSMQLGSKTTERPLGYRYADIAWQLPILAESRRAAPVPCGCYGDS